MASNGIGLTESIVYAPDVNDKAFAYRTGLGMVPSAEFTVYMDDFIQDVTSNVPTGWDAAVIDTGGTVTVNTTAAIGANGVITIGDATASEGAAIYGTKSIQLTSGKKFFMECRLRTDDVTDNTIQFGISALTATTNPEDLWTTTAADVVAFGILDGSATLKMLSDKSNSGSSVANSSGSLSTNTWTTLAIGYDGSQLYGYKDGKQVIQWATQAEIPTGVALAPFVGMLNGNGAGGNLVVVDYIRYVSER